MVKLLELCQHFFKSPLLNPYENPTTTDFCKVLLKHYSFCRRWPCAIFIELCTIRIRRVFKYLPILHLNPVSFVMTSLVLTMYQTFHIAVILIVIVYIVNITPNFFAFISKNDRHYLMYHLPTLWSVFFVCEVFERMDTNHFTLTSLFSCFIRSHQYMLPVFRFASHMHIIPRWCSAIQVLVTPWFAVIECTYFW